MVQKHKTRSSQPRTSHDVHSVRATDTNGACVEAARIGGVGVCANHQEARDGVVLEHCEESRSENAVDLVLETQCCST